jgi:RNA polymerase sigma-70 factor (ECF subfamily)
VTAASDEELLRAYQEGDMSAFEVLLSRYRRPLFTFLLRSVRDRGRAEEIYQDVWMRVIERADQFRGDSKFSTWLYRITRNRCIDHQRRMQFRRHASLDVVGQSGESLGERVASGQAATDQTAMRSALQQRIGAAVEQLPDDQREVFLLRQVQGMSFQDIAATVEISVNTAKSRMRYALERLREALSDLEEHAHELESETHGL